MLLNLSNEEKRNLVLNGSLYKGLLILSLPIMVNNLLQTMYNLADLYWLKGISILDVESGAVGIVFPVLMLFVTFGAGIQIAATALMSQHIGANNKEKANHLASQLFLFTFILGIIMSVLGIMLTPFVLHNIMQMDIHDYSYQLSASYLKIMFLTLPLDFTLMLFTAMRQSQGDTLTPVLYTVTAVLLNIALDPLFISVFKLGVPGAAYATIIAKLIIFPFWFYRAFHDKSGIHVDVKMMKMNFNTINKVILIMLPASISSAFNSIGFIVLNGTIASYGDTTTAAFVVGNNVTNIIMLPAMGIGSALAFFIGQNIGNNNYIRAKQAFHASITITLIIMFATMIIIMPSPIRSLISRIFLKEEESIKLSMEYMAFVGFSIPLMGIYQNFSGVFLGSGKTWYILFMSIARLWCIRIPMIQYFKYNTDFGSSGIWYSMVISNTIVCIIGFLFYRRGKWQRKIV